MRARLVHALGLLILLTGCAAQEPQLSIEPTVLDAVPVVPFVTSLGVSTAWLNEDSSLITVSHGIPRGEFSGPADVSSVPITYTVVASGDSLERLWSVWDSTIAHLGQGDDWAKVMPSQPLPPSSPTISPRYAAWSPQPPAVGEQLVLVGYTLEGGALQRYWVPVEVIDSPSEFRALDAGHHVWFRTQGREKLRNGFSGAPLLRLRSDGVLEPCAMMVSAAKRGGVPLDVGVAILVPKS